MWKGYIRLRIHIVKVIPDWEGHIRAELDPQVHIHPLVWIEKREWLIVYKAIVHKSNRIL